MSDVTSVPATPLNVSFGSLTAPSSSALSPMYLLTLSSFLSNVPEEVIKAIIPPFFTLSNDFAIK